MTRATSANLRDLAEHYLGALPPAASDEQLCRALSHYFYVHVTLRGPALVIVAHPTPGQQATALRFPVTHAKLEQTVEDTRHQASVQTPQMGVGFTTLPSGEQAIRLRANYAALVQLRDQLTAAIEHHDFDFTPYRYWRTDGQKPSGLVIDFLPDRSLPPLDAPASAPRRAS